jgi:hypothetical protein
VYNQLQLGLAHRTVRWRTGQCPVPQAGRRRTHRSREMKKVTWLKFTGLSGEPKALVANGRLRNPQATRGPQQTVGWAHPDSVRCANQPRGATIGCARYGRISRTRYEQWLSGAPLDRRQELPSKLVSNNF